MTVDELSEYLKHHGLELRERLLDGSYQPQPVRRVDIPKPDGKARALGLSTVLDRFIQQAIAQHSAPNGNPTFTRTATDFAHNAQPIKRCALCKRASVKATAGW